jgi:hypothetical protein
LHASTFAASAGGDSHLLRSSLGDIAARIRGLGVRLSIEFDFDGLLEARAESSDPWLYPTFDPRLSDLSEDALWLRAATPSGDTIATYAVRVFETGDFYDLMRSGALWFAQPAAERGGCRIVSATLPIAGLVGHCGAAWVHPAWRDRGLVQLLCRYGRALLLRDFAVDHETGLVAEHNYRSGLAQRAYGYPRVPKVVDGFFPPSGSEARVYLCHMSRAEMLDDLRSLRTAPRVREFA